MYLLRLYIIGQSKRSKEAVRNLKEILDEYCQGQYSLEVIDLLQNPLMAGYDQILITPTVIKLLPPPIRRVTGDLNDKTKVLIELDLLNREASGGKGRHTCG